MKQTLFGIAFTALAAMHAKAETAFWFSCDFVGEAGEHTVSFGLFPSSGNGVIAFDPSAEMRLSSALDFAVEVEQRPVQWIGTGYTLHVFFDDVAPTDWALSYNSQTQEALTYAEAHVTKSTTCRGGAEVTSENNELVINRGFANSGRAQNDMFRRYGGGVPPNPTARPGWVDADNDRSTPSGAAQASFLCEGEGDVYRRLEPLEGGNGSVTDFFGTESSIYWYERGGQTIVVDEVMTSSLIVTFDRETGEAMVPYEAGSLMDVICRPVAG